MENIVLLFEACPFVRFAAKIEVPYGNKCSIAYDHRLFYCLGESAGSIKINNIVYSFYKNTIIYIPSGCEYHFLSKNKVYSINFDFYPENSERKTPFPIVNSVECFDRAKQLENTNFQDYSLFNNTFVIESCETIKNLINDIVIEYRNKSIFYSKVISQYLNIILFQLIRENTFTSIGGTQEIHKSILEYIHAHYRENLSNSSIAERFNYHPNYINKIVIRYTDYTLHNYILQLRLDKALKLLQSSNMSITEISEFLGFNSVNYFSRFFKKRTGYPPHKHIQSH